MRGKVAEVAGSCIFCSMLSAKKRTAASSRVVQMLCWRSTAAFSLYAGAAALETVISIQCWDALESLE